MEITSVKVHKTDREGSHLKGYATVTLDNCFVVKNIRIIEDEDRLFISMPNRKVAEGQYEDVAHPINSETRQMFQDKVLEEYNNTPSKEEE